MQFTISVVTEIKTITGEQYTIGMATAVGWLLPLVLILAVNVMG